MDVIALKLTTGEEIVAQRMSSTNGGTHSICVMNPLALRMVQGRSGIDVGFFPWTMVAEEDAEIPINPELVVAIYTPKKEVIASYIQNVTGIELVGGFDGSQLLRG